MNCHRNASRGCLHWYKRGEISQKKAAQVAALDCTDLLLALAREGEDAIVVDFADLERELQRGRKCWDLGPGDLGSRVDVFPSLFRGHHH